MILNSLVPLLFPRPPAEAAAHGQLTELGNAENFLMLAAIGQLIIEMDLLFPPGDTIGMRFDAVEMTAERAQQLRQIHCRVRLHGKAFAPFTLALRVQPGNIAVFVMQRTVVAKQLGVAPRAGLSLPNPFGQVWFKQLGWLDRLGRANNETCSNFLQYETCYPEKLERITDSSKKF